MADWIDSTKTRTKKLDPYKDKILSWLREHPDMRAAQVEDWLREKDPGLKVSESTVRAYVRNLRKEYDIPKEIKTRDYEAIPELDMGEQIQVDFGKTWQETPDKRKVELYVITFVLSHSRYKYMEWLDRPFTTQDVINSHENAFEWFGGIPRELVYDQDHLIVVSENGGDIILTKEFEAYRQERKLKLSICRKADPESKGKVENVVGYVKHNFAEYREFTNIDRWNEDAKKWLNRTGNYKIHGTTKKRPVEVFQEEKKHLRPVTQKLLSNSIPSSSITRTVRKDNTILYESNRYSVPLGTYNKQKMVYIAQTGEHLLIYASPNGPLIAKHRLCHDKGKLIQDRQHTRDRSKGIDAYINTVVEYFTGTDTARIFLEEVRKKHQRYIRDQLQMILREIKRINQQGIIDMALKECMKKKLFCATDFIDMVRYIERQRQSYNTNQDKSGKPVKPLDGNDESFYQTMAQKRDVNEYLAVLEGQK
ncbi:IS21 family transposase [Bacillus alveayuensis]|uniref:IS21 family transposase n=1 Tax=Aeribacillus alveayuensis TaxID=279215 RepID=UPI000ADC7D44|nr:IS21 family transposase [Bacillus alveayuensis]